jgi:hypothetical protein
MFEGPGKSSAPHAALNETASKRNASAYDSARIFLRFKERRFAIAVLIRRRFQTAAP